MDTSPAQRLLNRRTKTVLPTKDKLLKPKLNNDVNDQRLLKQQKQAHYYNKNAKDLPKLKAGDVVHVQPAKYKKSWTKAVVRRQVAPRSYEITTDAGVKLRRNRNQLRSSKEHFQQQDSESDEDVPVQRQPVQLQPAQQHQRCAAQQQQRPQAPFRTRAGRSSRKPGYLRDYVTS